MLEPYNIIKKNMHFFSDRDLFGQAVLYLDSMLWKGGNGNLGLKFSRGVVALQLIVSSRFPVVGSLSSVKFRGEFRTFAWAGQSGCSLVARVVSRWPGWWGISCTLSCTCLNCKRIFSECIEWGMGEFIIQLQCIQYIVIILIISFWW